MKPLFPFNPHPNDPKLKNSLAYFPPYTQMYDQFDHAHCLCSPQTGARIIAYIQLGSSLMIIESAKSDNKGEERGKTAHKCAMNRIALFCNALHCTMDFIAL